MSKFIIELKEDAKTFDVGKPTSKDDLMIADSIEDNDSELICRKEIKITNAYDVAELQKIKAMYKSGAIDIKQYQTLFFKKAISIAEKTEDVSKFKVESAKFCDDCIILTFRSDKQKHEADDAAMYNAVNDALNENGIAATLIKAPYCYIMLNDANDAANAKHIASEALFAIDAKKAISIKGKCMIVIY